jgi:hypothetical protein
MTVNRLPNRGERGSGCLGIGGLKQSGRPASAPVEPDLIVGADKDFLGAPIECPTPAAMISGADCAIRSRQEPLQHVCINVPKFAAMRTNAEVDHDGCCSSDIISADGTGIVWGAQVLRASMARSAVWRAGSPVRDRKDFLER